MWLLRIVQNQGGLTIKIFNTGLASVIKESQGYHLPPTKSHEQKIETYAWPTKQNQGTTVIVCI